MMGPHSETLSDALRKTGQTDGGQLVPREPLFTVRHEHPHGGMCSPLRETLPPRRHTGTSTLLRKQMRTRHSEPFRVQGKSWRVGSWKPPIRACLAVYGDQDWTHHWLAVSLLSFFPQNPVAHYQCSPRPSSGHQDTGAESSGRRPSRLA